MKTKNGMFIPNCTEIKKAAAHLRKLERNATNSEGLQTSYYDCIFYIETGEFHYPEFSNPYSFIFIPYNEPHIYIPSTCGTEWEEDWERAEKIQKEILDIIERN